MDVDGAHRKGARGDHRKIEMEKAKLASKFRSALTRGMTRRYQGPEGAGYETGWLEKSWRWWQILSCVNQQDFLSLVQSTYRTKGISLLTVTKAGFKRTRTQTSTCL